VIRICAYAATNLPVKGFGQSLGRIAVGLLRYRLTNMRSVSLDVKNDPTTYGGSESLLTPQVESVAVLARQYGGSFTCPIK
jgi:hypothetical protein